MYKLKITFSLFIADHLPSTIIDTRVSVNPQICLMLAKSFLPLNPQINFVMLTKSFLPLNPLN